jgi:hypothetical protein
MKDEMIDLMAGDARLRRRLEAYAKSRLTPDLSATSRMRARVLVHAHRQAELVRADAALTIIRPGVDGERDAPPWHRNVRRTAISLVAAAALVAAMVGGAAGASAPGGALYEARIWVEDVTLPADPSVRAIAELDRLAQRLTEADAAARVGDHRAVAAALAAYERIMGDASAEILAAGDPVAAAAFEAGVGYNLDVLVALIDRVPPEAAQAITRAVERAIDRSASAIDRVDDVDKPHPATGGSDGNAGRGGSGASGGGAGGGAASTPKPTKAPNEPPGATTRPPREPNDRPAQTPEPVHEAQGTGNPGQGGPPGNAPD